MEKPIENYWKGRLTDVKGALEKNGFEVFLADDTEKANAIVLDRILPKTKAKSISWGGSTTFTSSGLYAALKDNPDLEIVDTYEKKLHDREKYERRRKALLVDLFISGTNAVTQSGKLVNLDMFGNRVAAITFGPNHVVILAGRNKIVPDVKAAMYRISDYAAPVNAMRLDKETPCAKTSFCARCSSPDRICNTWVITEKSFPQGRIKVILINQDMGF